MNDIVIGALISVACTAVGVGIAWGVLSERVANLKEQMNGKASSEGLAHLELRLNEIKDMLATLLARRDRGEHTDPGGR